MKTKVSVVFLFDVDANTVDNVEVTQTENTEELLLEVWLKTNQRPLDECESVEVVASGPTWVLAEYTSREGYRDHLHLSW